MHTKKNGKLSEEVVGMIDQRSKVPPKEIIKSFVRIFQQIPRREKVCARLVL